MSNVLIGVIAVILFIGLALAGALILGDDLRAASASSQGTALLSRMRQAADAASMYRLKTGQSEIPSTETDFLKPRFLKSAATSPLAAAKNAPADETYTYNPHFSLYPVGYDVDLSGPNCVNRYPAGTSHPARYVIALVGRTTDSRAKGICQAIVDASSGGEIPEERDPEMPGPGVSGCWRSHILLSCSHDYEPAYVAWMRL